MLQAAAFRLINFLTDEHYAYSMKLEDSCQDTTVTQYASNMHKAIRCISNVLCTCMPHALLPNGLRAIMHDQGSISVRTYHGMAHHDAQRRLNRQV